MISMSRTCKGGSSFTEAGDALSVGWGSMGGGHLRPARGET